MPGLVSTTSSRTANSAPGPLPLSTRRHSTQDDSKLTPGPSSQTGLLWINKDAKSTSLSNSKGDTKPINSHVQRLTAGQRRAQKLANAQSTSANAKRLADRRLIVRDYGKGDEKSAREKAGLPVPEPRVCKANFTKQACIDPFDMAPIPLDADAHKIIQYYFATNVSSSFKADVGRKSSDRQHRLSAQVERTFQGCLTKKVHMSVFLAVNAGRMIHITGVEPQTMRFARAQAYMHEAMKDVCKYFRSTRDVVKDEQIVLSLVWLMTYEWYFEHWDAVMTHMKAIKLLLEMVGEETEYRRYIKEVSSRSDVYLATELLSKPIFTLNLTKAPGPFRRWDQVPPSPIGEVFETALKKKQFSEPMYHIMAIVISCLRIRHFAEASPKSIPEDMGWVAQQIHVVMHQLLSADVQCGLRQEEECCRIALIILFCHVTTFTVKRSGPRNAVRLQSALRAVPGNSSLVLGREMLLWVFVTGMFAATEGSEAGDWFADRAVRTALMLGMEAYGDICEAMERHFWIPNLQAPTVDKLSMTVFLELFGDDQDG